MEKSYYNFDNLNVVNLYKWRKQGSSQNSLDLKIDYKVVRGEILLLTTERHSTVPSSDGSRGRKKTRIS